MTADLDAAFLAGFIVGTFDLRGDADVPAYVKPYIDRVMNGSNVEHNTITRPKKPQNYIRQVMDEPTPDQVKKLAADIVIASKSQIPIDDHAVERWTQPGYGKKVADEIFAPEEPQKRTGRIPDTDYDDIQKKRQPGPEQMTLDAIGKKYGVTGQSVTNYLRKRQSAV